MKKVHLLTIDGQNDFCIAKEGVRAGTLVVPGADEDTQRLAKFVEKVGDRLASIHATLDSHLPLHIAHGVMWVDSKGNHPNPFTVITKNDVEKGLWRSYAPQLQGKFLHYVTELEKNARYVLCIWPQHCIIGTWGHSLVPELAQAFVDWQNKYFKRIDYVAKGSNMLTEHYSAVQADVPDDGDPTTKLNTQLIDVLAQKADEILITGQALSHCVASTIKDIAANFGADQVKKFTLLEDTCSNVPGFEKLGEDFVKDMTARGMKTTTTAHWS